MLPLLVRQAITRIVQHFIHEHNVSWTDLNHSIDESNVYVSLLLSSEARKTNEELHQICIRFADLDVEIQPSTPKAAITNLSDKLHLIVFDIYRQTFSPKVDTDIHFGKRISSERILHRSRVVCVNN